METKSESADVGKADPAGTKDWSGKILPFPEPSPIAWKCELSPDVRWLFPEGSQPSPFYRFMQRLLLGVSWSRVHQDGIEIHSYRSFGRSRQTPPSKDVELFAAFAKVTVVVGAIGYAALAGYLLRGLFVGGH